MSQTTQVRSPKHGRLVRASSLPATMPLGEFLFAYLHGKGVHHAFGVPGDFALPTFAWLEKSPIQCITMTHEPGAGFAADAYARIHGLGLVVVTYCVGGLNALNAIAGAYAEKSPVVVISGAPGRADREKDPLLHHKVKTFETQRRVYDEVTVASTVLLNEQTAAAEIMRVIDAAIQQKRPVYIEVPHDIVDKQIPIPTQRFNDLTAHASDPATLAAALEETRAVLAAAKKPVIFAGVELHRHNLIEPVLKFAEALNIPIAADLLSKSVVAENHPLYLGVYGGAMSSSLACRDYVESADCVLMLGTFITDMSMGIYTAKLERTHVILATTERLRIHYHTYEDIQLPDYRAGLQDLAAPAHETRTTAHEPRTNLQPFQFTHPTPHEDPVPLAHAELTAPLNMESLLHILSLHLDENCCVISDVGDALFGAVGIRTARRAEFIAPAYYLSMGFAVPASIGVSMAAPNLRPVVLVGDGAFQMTGTELSTAVRLNLKPIIIILNNDGFGTICINPRRRLQHHLPLELRQNLRTSSAAATTPPPKPRASSTVPSNPPWPPTPSPSSTPGSPATTCPPNSKT